MADKTHFSGSTVDDAEIAHFSAMAAEWWSPTGKFRPLHKQNPTRLAFIRENIIAHYGLDESVQSPFGSLKMLDIGCGGGLISEPMSRMGAQMTGADASEVNIGIASTHAKEMGLDIDYRATTAESLAEAGESFDVVLAMEVVEHVSDVPLFIKACTSMVKPGGLMFMSTLNRTMKSWALAIVGAEYILRWLPVGTHQWDKFVTPDELEAAFAPTPLTMTKKEGMIYNPVLDRWSRGKDMDINYMVMCERGED
ncbi:MAG: bifunctional 2-polyprenyl-6-hydroxyphenol methylase/3-demethylubiquinol 3-O-methyltransferase UbiG [Cohaesibacter sp.]|jgi:2-polyprenyl-6-hydroxyphenyl methylase/3-demethylubiquinone-9 3-methyltransferase|nr:bifunctional 2-polyprenyl-6-hydroxyphenol methylase/3-demethylubiquinol 3-O-methyltransferase UbiG [Cohaesibacter sp.]